VDVWLGEAKTVNAVAAKNLIQTHLISDDIQASSVVRYQQPVLAPIKKGQKLGTITTILPDKTLVETDLLAAENVEKVGFFGKIKALFCG